LIVLYRFRNRKEYLNIGLDGNVIKDIWGLDFKKLEKLITNKTKLLIINSPHNPTGKIFSQEELERISELVLRHPNLYVISDEVYEHIIFDEYKALPRIANIKGMWDRTLTIMSAGKTFSATGVRIGWGIGPKHLIQAMHALHQYNTFCAYEPIQEAIGECLDEANKPYLGESNYYIWLRKHYENTRNYFIKNLAESMNDKFSFWLPEGGYFVISDIKKSNN